MFRVRRFLTAAAVVGASLAVVAPLRASDLEHIEIHTEAWQDYAEPDGTGFAWDVIRAVYKPAGIAVRFSIVPYSRAVQDVLAARADAWIGSYDNEQEGAIYPDWHYDADRVEALFPKSKLDSWKGRASLENARVGWIRDYAYDTYMNVSVREVLLKNRRRALMLLKRGRLDYWLDAAYEQEHLLENAPESIDPSKYVRRHVLYKRLYLGFADTARGRELARIWDRRFPKLLKRGRIAEIYDSWDFEVWPFEVPRPSS
jgi:polar amino acid transport system substrate-binding protein